MAFTQKLLDFQFQLEKGTSGTGAGSGNSATISGLRASCKIVNAGGQGMGVLDASIYGLTLSQMNQLSTVGTQLDTIGHNSITVLAGDADSGMNIAYQGTIIWAYMDGQSQPQVPFRVAANAGTFEAAMATDPTSVQGSGDAAETAQKIATTAGLQFENNGVDTKLSNIYLPRSPREQILSLAEAAGFDWTIDCGTLVVCKKGQPRQGNGVIISPQTGMIGYPGFSQDGVVVRCLYKPELRLYTKITVQSDITPACGDWLVKNILVDLESMTPSGKWFITIEAGRVGK